MKKLWVFMVFVSFVLICVSREKNNVGNANKFWGIFETMISILHGND